MRNASATRNVRSAGLFLTLASGGLALAQGLPATAATQSGSAPQPQAHQVTHTMINEAQVTFSGGLLTVKADNSSLNKILASISSTTGMKITGGIGEERVFGSYGPARPQDVLTQLLDGTGSNVLLYENPDHTVKELVLSARNGGVTPPNPAASASRNEETFQAPTPEERMRVLRERRNAGMSQYQGRNPLGTGNQPDLNNNPQQQLPQSPNGVRNPGQFGPLNGVTSGSLPPETNTPPN